MMRALLALLGLLWVGSAVAQTATTDCYGRDVPAGVVVNVSREDGTKCAAVLGTSGATGTISDNFEGTKATYNGSVVGLVAAANATDIFTICGSASKVVRVIRMDVSGTATAASTVDLLVIKRSAADTGGTSAGVTMGPSDSTDGAPTATALSYTVNPAGLGASVGTMRAMKLSLPATGGNQSAIFYQYGIALDRAIVLRGVAQCIGINLNAGTIPAGISLDISASFTEE